MRTPVDMERLRTLATSLRGNLQRSRHYAFLPDDEFWKDERNILSVKLLLLQAIEDAAAICSHLLARLGGQVASYAECFEGLERLGVLPPDLTQRLTATARFRNLLVHRYWEEVDDQRVLQFARHDVVDLETYLQAIGQFLSQQL